MKFFKAFFITLCGIFLIFGSIPQQASAASVKPFPPFSEEGNPSEGYFFDNIFPLLRFIPAKNFQIYENQDRSRKYDLYEVCSGGDHRDYECTNTDPTCDGGPVDICHLNGGPAYTGYSKPNDSCSAKKIDDAHPPGTKGSCSYKKTPKVVKELKGTDFTTGLIYPKIQSGSGAYSYIGSNDNPITYGSLYLSNDQCEIITKKLIVVRRAAHTKETLRITGEWPLGWVDWGYKTPNGKTLLEINKAIPDDIAGNLNGLIEGLDDYFLTGGDLEKVSDVSEERNNICRAYQKYASTSPQPQWLLDLDQSPLYPPSFRQGYTRVSICVWGLCCLTTRCPIDPLGNNKGLYYDTAISQAYNAAIDDLFMRHSLTDGNKLFKQLVTQNPLVRYLTSASPAAVPTAISLKQEEMLKGTCYDYHPWGRWLTFSTYVDYMDGSALDPEKKCPGYELMPELTKESANAYSPGGGSFLISLLWGGPVDELAQVKMHHITIPDAMGQSIKSVQQMVYNTKDTLNTLEGIEEYNNSLSNSIESKDGEVFYGGEASFPQNSKRNVSAIYGCSDPMYSAHEPTSIADYANGVRNGCYDDQLVPEGKCDGKLFSQLISDSKYTEASEKGQEYFQTNIKGMLTPELMKTYAAAEKATGVPCEILAGIHFVEADNNPEGSLVSGRRIGESEPDAGGKVFKSLIETAIYAGDHLKGKVGGQLNNANTIITALSRYNGGGNSNCQLGYPYPIPYQGCPRLFEGEDDPYPTNFLDNKHDQMYLLYCADHTACEPQVFERPGSFTVALEVYNNLTKSGYTNSDLPPDRPKSSKVPSTPEESKPLPIFFPKSCGEGTLSTALGCLPYTTHAFVVTILRFLSGISGAISLVIMLMSTIRIVTAAGDAKKIQSGKDLFLAAISGLLFIIFSVSILRIFGVDILKLNGF